MSLAQGKKQAKNIAMHKPDHVHFTQPEDKEDPIILELYIILPVHL
jgi:hypothetical protein